MIGFALGVAAIAAATPILPAIAAQASYFGSKTVIQMTEEPNHLKPYAEQLRTQKEKICSLAGTTLSRLGQWTCVLSLSPLAGAIPFTMTRHIFTAFGSGHEIVWPVAAMTGLGVAAGLGCVLLITGLALRYFANAGIRDLERENPEIPLKGKTLETFTRNQQQEMHEVSNKYLSLESDLNNINECGPRSALHTYIPALENEKRVLALRYAIQAQQLSQETKRVKQELSAMSKEAMDRR